MARSDSRPVISMKVLVKENGVFPEGVFGVPNIIAVTRTSTGTVSQEEIAEASRELVGYLSEIHKISATGWALYFEGVAVELVVAVESFDEEKVNRKPYGAPPV